jgi:polyphosphate kinase 2 (PPK2 family)
VLTAFRDAGRRHLQRRALQAQARRQLERLAEPEVAPAAAVPAAAARPAELSILGTLDMGLECSKDRYNREMPRQTARLATLYRKAKQRGLSTVALFEGWDAAGKGGAIRRITGALDARDYQVFPIAAPTEEERGHHYLWRFWRHMSRAGRITLFDRSWYGRVLVERVEALAAEDDWRRAYTEINTFEQQLTEHGIILVKYWLHITKDEQLQRFEHRASVPYKRWKLTDDDWRNRDKWEAYELAVNDMIEKTSTSQAPWTLIPANSKPYARLQVVETLCQRLEDAIARAKASGARKG